MTSPLHSPTPERPVSERADSKGIGSSGGRTKTDEKLATLPAQYPVLSTKERTELLACLTDIKDNLNTPNNSQYRTAASTFLRTLGVPDTIAKPVMGLMAEYLFTSTYINFAIGNIEDRSLALALWQRITSICDGNEWPSSDFYTSLYDFHEPSKSSLLPEPRIVKYGDPEAIEALQNTFHPIADAIDTNDDQHTVIYRNGRIFVTNKNDQSVQICETNIFDWLPSNEWRPLEFCLSYEVPIVYIMMVSEVKGGCLLAYDITLALKCPLPPTKPQTPIMTLCVDSKDYKVVPKKEPVRKSYSITFNLFRTSSCPNEKLTIVRPGDWLISKKEDITLFDPKSTEQAICKRWEHEGDFEGIVAQNVTITFPKDSTGNNTLMFVKFAASKHSQACGMLRGFDSITHIAFDLDNQAVAIGFPYPDNIKLFHSQINPDRADTIEDSILSSPYNPHVSTFTFVPGANQLISCLSSQSTLMCYNYRISNNQIFVIPREIKSQEKDISSQTLFSCPSSPFTFMTVRKANGKTEIVASSCGITYTGELCTGNPLTVKVTGEWNKRVTLIWLTEVVTMSRGKSTIPKPVLPAPKTAPAPTPPIWGPSADERKIEVRPSVAAFASATGEAATSATSSIAATPAATKAAPHAAASSPLHSRFAAADSKRNTASFVERALSLCRQLVEDAKQGETSDDFVKAWNGCVKLKADIAQHLHEQNQPQADASAAFTLLVNQMKDPKKPIPELETTEFALRK